MHAASASMMINHWRIGQAQQTNHSVAFAVRFHYVFLLLSELVRFDYVSSLALHLELA
jgi:hypothetical protein